MLLQLCVWMRIFIRALVQKLFVYWWMDKCNSKISLAFNIWLLKLMNFPNENNIHCPKINSVKKIFSSCCFAFSHDCGRKQTLIWSHLHSPLFLDSEATLKAAGAISSFWCQSNPLERDQGAWPSMLCVSMNARSPAWEHMACYGHTRKKKQCTALVGGTQKGR